MMDLLALTLAAETPKQTMGETQRFSWQWQAEGVLQCTPKVAYDKTVVLSAGIHGNETAPIELLNAIIDAIFSQKLVLNVRILFVLGSPLAMRKGVRYLDNDMNRMFCGAYKKLNPDAETQRAEVLEQLLTEFFNTSLATAQRFHFDLHTAIRASLLPVFALFPFQQQPYNADVLQALNAADLDAIVYHSEAAKTFTHFSAEFLHAASVTLELGKAKPFGQNNLADFSAIDAVLRAFISQSPLPKRTKAPIQNFKVVASVLKQHKNFKLNLSDDAPNFSNFEKNEVIAEQTGQNYIADEQVWILFPNPKVKLGLRAGLILKTINTVNIA